MNFRDTILQILEQILQEYPTLFLIECTVGTNQSVKVVLDGDEDIRLQDCMEINRKMERKLDEEEHTFSLEVTSCGVGSPLQKVRQYPKNKGRKLEVHLSEGQSILGVLEAADSESVTLTWKEREPKPIGKGKTTVNKQKIIKYNEIALARVVI